MYGQIVVRSIPQLDDHFLTYYDDDITDSRRPLAPLDCHFDHMLKLSLRRYRSRFDFGLSEGLSIHDRMEEEMRSFF